jgi:hypothetical protein
VTAVCRGGNLTGNARPKHVLVAVAGWQCLGKLRNFNFIPTATDWKCYAQILREVAS